MIRKIISIDESRCNGCGLCISACHEGALGLVEGKARLLKEDHCDGLGDCLPACPMNAITFTEREALAYDEQAVRRSKGISSCPSPNSGHSPQGAVSNFPIQLRLVNSKAEFLQDSQLLVAADCCAYCRPNFHESFRDGKVLLIGCPKLDPVNYEEKFEEILRNNNIRSITLTRMTVPCCGGLSYAVQRAIERCGQEIPLQIIRIRPDGTTE